MVHASRIGACLAAALTLLLQGCGDEPRQDAGELSDLRETGQSEETGTGVSSAAPSVSGNDANSISGDNILTPDGLGLLVIGKPLPAGSSWTVSGAQVSDSCLIAASRDFPSAYAILEDGVVRRISAGDGSALALANGVKAGMAESEVRRRMGALRSEPHAYVEPPGKYLFASGAQPRVMIEIGAEGRVNQLHVGTMPVLGYVEGCA